MCMDIAHGEDANALGKNARRFLPFAKPQMSQGRLRGESANEITLYIKSRGTVFFHCLRETTSAPS